MYSNFVSFEEIIELVKDDTGIENLRNLYPKITRFIYRAEKDIGFGGSTILKRLTYSVNAGSILFDGNQYKLRLPDDMMYLEEVGMCKEGICPGDYTIQGNWMFFCKGHKIEKFSLIYYTLLLDGEGHPVTTANHSEAVVAGITYWLYKARRFKDKGQYNQMRYYEDYYHERISEARGDDATPNTEREWQKLSQMMNMGSKEIFLYSEADNCFCEIPEGMAPVYNPVTRTLMPAGNIETTVSPSPAGNTVGTGAGGSTDGDGAYIDPNEVVVPTEPVEPEPVNQPPTINDLEIQAVIGVTTIISLDLFEGYAGAPYSDPENDALAKIRVDAINPYNLGIFFINGIPIQVGHEATRAQLAANLFTHVSGSEDEFHTDYISFSVWDSVNEKWVS